VITHAHTSKVLLDGVHGDQRATGVSYLHQGQTHELRARREVLLSGGAFGSPQLLMLSVWALQSTCANTGIPVRHVLPGVGQNLQDHVTTVLIYRTRHQQETLGFSLKGALNMVKSVFEWRAKRTGSITANVAESRPSWNPTRRGGRLASSSRFAPASWTTTPAKPTSATATPCTSP